MVGHAWLAHSARLWLRFSQTEVILEPVTEWAQHQYVGGLSRWGKIKWLMAPLNSTRICVQLLYVVTTHLDDPGQMEGMHTQFVLASVAWKVILEIWSNWLTHVFDFGLFLAVPGDGT